MTDWRGRASEVSWVLLPLRAFLGIVFLDAGISKIADRRFLDSSSPRSIYANLLAVRHSSPIGGLLGPVQHHSVGFGIAMAIAELAVGLGVLVGFATRVAAAGGMVIALSLWLTVSWGAVPWFTSADVVYLFALTPLLIAGAGEFSADAWLARVRRAHPGVSEDRMRRALLAGGLSVIGGVLLAGAAVARKPKHRLAAAASDTPTPSPSHATSSAAATGSLSGPVLAAAADVPLGGATQVTDPQSGTPVYVLQLQPGQFSALSAICTHEGCTIDFVSPQLGFRCPCHQSQFSVTGAVTQGPANSDLARIPVQVSDGQVRATT